MGYNYSREKRKFDAEWKKKEEWCKNRRQQPNCTENLNHRHGELNQFTTNPKKPW